MLLKQTVFLLGVNLLYWVGAGVAQDNGTIAEVQNERYAVRLLPQESHRLDSVDFIWTFVVKDKSTYTESSFQIRNMTDELQELVLVNGLLVVLGHVQRFADSATLLDLIAKTEKDFLMGY